MSSPNAPLYYLVKKNGMDQLVDLRPKQIDYSLGGPIPGGYCRYRINQKSEKFISLRASVRPPYTGNCSMSYPGVL